MQIHAHKIKVVKGRLHSLDRCSCLFCPANNPTFRLAAWRKSGGGPDGHWEVLVRSAGTIGPDNHKHAAISFRKPLRRTVANTLLDLLGWISVSEAAEIFGISKQAVRGLIERGAPLGACRIRLNPGQYLIVLDETLVLVEAERRENLTPPGRSTLGSPGAP